MKVKDLSVELELTNKELITFLKENGYAISSHMQNLNDEMIDKARERFAKKEKVKEEVATKTLSDVTREIKDMSVEEVKRFNPDDLIPCKSVTPWELVAVGMDKNTVYHWNGYGDVDYVSYRDLQSFRRKDLIKKPKVIIEDADLCYQWRRELGDTYKYYLGVEYPEEFFDLTDREFEKLLRVAPNTIKEVIKFTAMNMVRNQNYPTLQKLTLVDEILGTCIKDFL